MTPDEIKKIGEMDLGKNGLVLDDIQAIYDAANKDAFWMICYAYTLGFTRGSQAAKEGAGMKQGNKLSNIPDLWAIAADTEDAGIELERIQYMLQILNENLEDEVDFLKKADSGHAQHFVSRYDIHRAQLEMVELWLFKTREDLAKLPVAIRSHYKTTEDQHEG